MAVAFLTSQNLTEPNVSSDKMSSSTFQFSIAAVTLVVALSGCGRKPDVKTEASKQDNPFAMKEVPTTTQVPSGNAASASDPQSGGNAAVNAFQSAAGTNANAGGTLAARKTQQPPGVTADQRSAQEESSLGTTNNFSERVAMKAQLKNGRKMVNDAQ